MSDQVLSFFFFCMIRTAPIAVAESAIRPIQRPMWESSPVLGVLPPPLEEVQTRSSGEQPCTVKLSVEPDTI